MLRAVIFDMFETLITLYESPVYFGRQIAEDMGIRYDLFRQDWDSTERDRSIGKATLEEVLKTIMKKHNCYSYDIMKSVAAKRIAAKREAFSHLHPEIIPMLNRLKEQNIKIGLISNCFSEEATVIRESALFPFFDAVFLSYEQGVQKPDKEIFMRCMSELGVSPEECIYIGDGGSNELEAAREIGMKALQAAWYLKEGTMQPAKKKEDFLHLATPYDIYNFI